MNRIKELRNKNGITLAKLGSEIDIRDNTLSQYENGKRNPSSETLNKIAKYFNVSLGYVAGLENETYEYQEKIASHISKIYDITDYIYEPSSKIDLESLFKNRDSKIIDEAYDKNIFFNKNIDEREISYSFNTFLKDTDTKKYNKLIDYINKLNIINGQKNKNDIQKFRSNIKKILMPTVKKLAIFIKDNYLEDIIESNWKTLNPVIKNWFDFERIENKDKNKSDIQNRIDKSINNIISKTFDMNVLINKIYENKKTTKECKIKSSNDEIDKLISDLKKLKQTIHDITIE